MYKILYFSSSGIKIFSVKIFQLKVSYFVVLFTMRSEGDFIAFSETLLLSMFFSYIDQRCLALYLQEATHLRENTLQSFHQRWTSDQLITTFFSPFSPPRGLKRPSTTSHSRSVRHCTSLYSQQQSYRGSSRHPKTMDCPRMYLSIMNFFVTMKDP